MNFEDAMEAAEASWFDTRYFSESIVYAGETIPANIDREGNSDEGRGSVKESVVVEIRKADVPSPAYRDAILIDGEAWTVAKPVGGDNIAWKVLAEKGERPVFGK
jgi:hypothetical protein